MVTYKKKLFTGVTPFSFRGRDLVFSVESVQLLINHLDSGIRLWIHLSALPPI